MHVLSSPWKNFGLIPFDAAALLRDCCVIYALHYTTSTEAQIHVAPPPRLSETSGRIIYSVYSLLLLRAKSPRGLVWRGRPSGRRTERSWRDNEGSVRLKKNKKIETPPAAVARGPVNAKRHRRRNKARILFKQDIRNKRWPTLWTWPSYYFAYTAQ